MLKGNLEKKVKIIQGNRNPLGVLNVARELRKYFDSNASKSIELDMKKGTVFGAYFENKLIGFAIYKKENANTVELAWLGIIPRMQGKQIGKKLVEESLEKLSPRYKMCKVKTLSETDPYKPYKKTRVFYKRLGFISIETIYPYPGWGDNACQIFVKSLERKKKVQK